MKKPKISICIPAYKQPDYLRRTLQSIFMQTYDDYEIVITDDSPNDSVEKVVNEFQPNPKIVYFRNKARKGSPDNWNTAISLSRGDYIKIMHHDDWFSRKQSLSSFVKMLDEHPDADFAFSANVVADINQIPQYTHTATAEQIIGLKKDPKVLFLGNFVGSPSSTIYRSIVQKKFDIHLKWVVDIDFYIAVLQKNKNFVYCIDPLVCCSLGVHGQVTSECSGNRNIQLFEWIYLYKKIENSQIPNFKRSIFIWNLLKGYQVKSVNEIIMSGLEPPIPRIIRIFIMLLRINNVAFTVKASVLKTMKSVINMKSVLGKIKKYIKSRYNARTEHPIYRLLKNINIYYKWVRSGKPIPPPHLIKRLTIKKYARKYKAAILIETGTYLGEMVDGVKYSFKKIYSIELSEHLYKDAVKKFANDKQVVILNGDSAEVLPNILAATNEKCIFWLDGHYSAGNTAKGDKNTPILAELEHILNHSVKGHIVLIDDARAFNGKDDYPTLDNLSKTVKEKNPNYQIQVKDDIIRLT